ncbi:hypothetical protein V2J09_010333, partial [Rumex salicifolius]
WPFSIPSFTHALPSVINCLATVLFLPQRLRQPFFKDCFAVHFAPQFTAKSLTLTNCPSRTMASSSTTGISGVGAAKKQKKATCGNPGKCCDIMAIVWIRLQA